MSRPVEGDCTCGARVWRDGKTPRCINNLDATIEAALSRDTEHDRLMREVVEAVARKVRACGSDRKVGSCTGCVWREVCAALDRLTDYEGSNND